MGGLRIQRYAVRSEECGSHVQKACKPNVLRSNRKDDGGIRGRHAGENPQSRRPPCRPKAMF